MPEAPAFVTHVSNVAPCEITGELGDRVIEHMSARAGAPRPPVGITASGETTSAFSVEWVPPFGSADRPTSYKLTIEPVPKDSPGQYEVDASTETYAFSGLSPGTQYTVCIISVNENGASTSKSVKMETVAPSEPNAPDAPEATVIKTDSIGLSWDLGSPNGGSPITEWEVTRTAGSDPTDIKVARTKKCPFSIDKLKAGTIYTVELRATNEVGWSPSSAGARFITEAPVPPAPASICEATETTPIAITIRWAAPRCPGCKITGYDVSWSKSGPGMELQPLVQNKLVTSSRITGLQGNTEYQFSITATNEYDMSSKPALHVFKTSAPTPPDAPTNVAVSLNLPAELVLTWKPPQNDNGAAVTSYSVHFKPKGGKLWKLLRANVVEARLETPDLPPAIEVQLMVHALNGKGKSPESEAVTATTANALPPTTISLAVGEVTQDTVQLSWTAPEKDYGAKVTSYIVEYKGRTDGVFSKTNFGRELTGTLEGMKPGMEYELRVLCKNSAGNSEPSAEVKVQMAHAEMAMGAEDDDGYDSDNATRDAAAVKEARKGREAAKAAHQKEKAAKESAAAKERATKAAEQAESRKAAENAVARRRAEAKNFAYLAQKDAEAKKDAELQRAAAAQAQGPQLTADERNRGRLEAIAIELIMRMQSKAYLLNGTLQQKACEGLSALVADHPGLVPAVLKHGGLPAVITAMTAYPRAVTVQCPGTAVFRALLSAPDDLAKAMAPEAVHGVVGAMQKAPWSSNLNAVASQMIGVFVAHNTC